MSDHDHRSHRAGPTDAVSGAALVGIWGLRGVLKLPVAKNRTLEPLSLHRSDLTPPAGDP